MKKVSILVLLITNVSLSAGFAGTKGTLAQAAQKCPTACQREGFKGWNNEVIDEGSGFIGCTCK